MTDTVKQNVTNASSPWMRSGQYVHIAKDKLTVRAQKCVCRTSCSLLPSCSFLSYFPSLLAKSEQSERSPKGTVKIRFHDRAGLNGKCPPKAHVFKHLPTPTVGHDVWGVCRTFQRQSMLGEELHWGLTLKINSLASLTVFFFGFLCIGEI